MPTPTAEEILHRVHTERPRGWRRFTLDHAQRVAKSLDRVSWVGSIVMDGQKVAPRELDDSQLRRLADNVRTNNGAVGFGMGAVFTWLAWKLVETAVWWAIKWAWNQKWRTQQ